MGTKQEVIARWEGGKVLPSTRTLARLAKATGTTLNISFAPSRTTAGKSGSASKVAANRPRRVAAAS